MAMYEYGLYLDSSSIVAPNPKSTLSLSEGEMRRKRAPKPNIAIALNMCLIPGPKYYLGAVSRCAQCC